MGYKRKNRYYLNIISCYFVNNYCTRLCMKEVMQVYWLQVWNINRLNNANTGHVQQQDFQHTKIP